MKLVVVLGTAGLIAGALWMFQPPSQDPQERARQEQNRQVESLSDSDEVERDRYRERGRDHLNAELQQELQPGERRPPEPRLRIRLP